MQTDSQDDIGFKRTERFLKAMARAHDRRAPGCPDPQAKRHETFLNDLLEKEAQRCIDPDIKRAESQLERLERQGSDGIYRQL